MQNSRTYYLLSARVAAGLACVGGAADSAFADGPSVELTGDVRLRYESIEVEPGADVDRERYRARLGLEAAFSESFTAHVRLATGTGDPVSTNLNFGESFTLDDVQLDRAWLEWRINGAARMHAGKMKNPLYRPGDTSLNWDSDLNPTGIAATFGRDLTHVNLAVFQVADQGSEHSRLYAAQAGTGWTLRGDDTLVVGASYYDYTNTRGQRPFYEGVAAGNTVDADGNYVYDYDIVELYVEYGFSPGGIPLELFGDWVRNLDPGRQNRAWAVGVNAGRAEERGDLEVSWARHDTEADALIGVFTDSDLGGGGTDSRGDVFRVGYLLTDGLSLGATVILSEFGGFSGPRRDYDRVMLDMEFRF